MLGVLQSRVFSNQRQVRFSDTLSFVRRISLFVVSWVSATSVGQLATTSLFGLVGFMLASIATHRVLLTRISG
jgi:hypothetical protein